MQERKRVAFATLGCKVNQYDTQAMQELFENAGYEIVSFQELADVYVINTCTVTQTSDKKSRQLVSRAHAQNPRGMVVVTGCYAQQSPERAMELPGVRLVLGTAERNQIVAHVERAWEETANCVRDIRKERVFEEISAVHEGKTRAHLKIQDGCDQYCSYCIIPYVRGPVRSRQLAQVVSEAKKLAQAGFCEIVLTGIHLMSYGKDLADTELIDAVDAITEIDGIRRIRLGSLEPAWIEERVVRAWAENPKVCRQFHLSLQSGCDTVLKRMNRRYTAAKYAEAVACLRENMPGCAITTDVIAGFAGETEEEHRKTLAFAEKMAFARMHVFPYSQRKGTKAAEMPGQVPKAVREKRAQELIALGERMAKEYLHAAIGSVQDVLIEHSENGWGEGYTGTYIRTRAPGKENEIVRVRITGVDDDGLAHGVSIV